MQVEEINPAYTSLIGKIKFAKKYGLSIHHAAALCIARRITKYSETLPSHSDIPDGKGSHVALSLPVWNRQRPYSSHLKQVARKLQAAYVKHSRVTHCQSTGPPGS